jgi:hypothetical protein
VVGKRHRRTCSQRAADLRLSHLERRSRCAPPRRLATLALAATAGLSLAACSTTIEAKPVSSTQSAASEPADPPVAEAADTGTPDADAGSSGTSSSGTGTGSTRSDSTGGQDIPEPGAGVTGDECLCQAVGGWYGYVGLPLLATDESGQVNPSDVVPLLEPLRDAPAGARTPATICSPPRPTSPPPPTT